MQVCLLAVLLLGLGLIRFRWNLAVPYGWSLAPPPEAPYPPWALLPALLVALACGLPVIRLLARHAEPTRRQAAGALALLALLVVGLQQTCEAGLGRRQWAVNTVAATCATISNGYFWTALEHPRPLELLRNYPELQRRDNEKIATHPPGAVLSYELAIGLYRALPPARWLAEGVLDWTGGDYLDVRLAIAAFPSVPREIPASAVPIALWCAWFTAALGALAVVPVYLLGAADGSRRTGLTAALVLAWMPNVAFYHLSLDGPLMALSAATMAGLARALRGAEPRLGAALAGGAALGLSLLVSLGAAPTLAMGVVLVALRGKSLGPRRAGSVLGALAAGVLVVLGLAMLLGCDLPTVYRQALDAHRHGGGGIGHRPYAGWLVFNVICYVALAGIPVTMIAGEGLLRRELGPLTTALALSLVLVATLLNLSGTVRAETERLWLFMNPLLAASAAAAAAGRPERAWPLAIGPLQWCLLALAMPPLVRPY